MRSFLIRVSWAVAIVTGTAFAITMLGQRGIGEEAVNPGKGAIKRSDKISPRDVPITVEVYEYGFNPTKTVIKAGQAVAFRGVGKEMHDVVAATEAGEPYFQAAEDRGSTRPIFTEPGSFPIVCSIHPQMRGKIEVVADF